MMTLLAALTILAVLAGCAADETTAPIGSGGSGGSTTIEGVVYKPFASGHADKFSLGDFDSPYLVRLDDYTNFVASNSSVLLNNTAHEVTKTDYQGGVYLGIADFSFSDYTSFIGTNAGLTIKVNLVEANGSVITNETIASNLVVTEAASIYTWQDLQGMKHNLNGDYVLRNSITFPDKGREGLPPEGFEPVGDNSIRDGSNRFTGSFAGNNHRIANFSIERPTRDGVGIWGSVSNINKVIENFVVDHAGIKGNDTVGGVAGRLGKGIIRNVGVVSSQGMSVSGNFDVGGLLGKNGNEARVNGYATGAVSGNFDVGGLVGDNFFSGTINGYATGAVSGNSQVGGLVGNNDGPEARVNGYATGAVSGTGDVGGLVGLNKNDAAVNGYATGAVTGVTNVAGLVGYNTLRGTANGYATGNVTGVTNVGGLVGNNGRNIFGTGTVNGYATGAVTGSTNVAGLVGYNGTNATTTGYATGVVTGVTNVAGLVGENRDNGIVNGYWDIASSGEANGFGDNSATFNGQSISAIANVVFTSLILTRIAGIVTQ